jgi:hypothetical protein
MGKFIPDLFLNNSSQFYFLRYENTDLGISVVYGADCFRRNSRIGRKTQRKNLCQTPNTALSYSPTEVDE